MTSTRHCLVHSSGMSKGGGYLARCNMITAQALTVASAVGRNQLHNSTLTPGLLKVRRLIQASGRKPVGLRSVAPVRRSLLRDSSLTWGLPDRLGHHPPSTRPRPTTRLNRRDVQTAALLPTYPQRMLGCRRSRTATAAAAKGRCSGVSPSTPTPRTHLLLGGTGRQGKGRNYRDLGSAVGRKTRRLT